ncbi:GDP-L-fucose synthase [Lysobacter sp. TY2-98]|uniref:GDP-L-fucose synthase family protein n=1 Tax=Lysobacter sp. TY2-98 TaxID=2290922 RepID=UPI000E200A48|nr:GDP-L-fucose synthase [Lysobacter sp. TY2-98]AXK70986.1 GDP-L-fucose synthase [Lysobacter sp. TY2-98]
MTAFDLGRKVFVAGHRGLVGSAVVRALHAQGARPPIVKGRNELDLADQAAVDDFFSNERPDYVFLCAAHVGGIQANASFPAEFIRNNLAIQTNVIHSAWKHGVSKLLFLGSSCIYPKFAAQPIREDALLTGALEATNEAYAIAKIAGLAMCQAYRRQYGFDAIVPMPTNLYGPGDNYDADGSHVVAGLIRRFVSAVQTGDREVVVWGTGTPLREFLYVDDLADALIHLMHHYESDEPINVGTGQELSIDELARRIAAACGFTGTVTFDASRPDGTPRKRLDTSKLDAMGWRARTDLDTGLRRTVAAYRQLLE